MCIFSSELSPQSFLPLHTSDCKIQAPFSHANSLTKSQTLQLSGSSELSPQSLLPSQ